jgi:hypothetical protein
LQIESLVRKLEGEGVVFRLVGKSVTIRANSARPPALEDLAALRDHKTQLRRFLTDRDAKIRPVQEVLHQTDSFVGSRNIESAEEEYRQKLRELMSRICIAPYRDGMIPWLRQFHSDLHEALTSSLPREIDRMWAEKSPSQDFHAALDRFFQAHTSARHLYEEYVAAKPQDSELTISPAHVLRSKGVPR